MSKRKNEKNKEKQKKLGVLFGTIGLTLVVLIVSTYAWFIGMSVASVDQFEVKVSGQLDILELSLDGYSWTTDLTVNSTSIGAKAEDADEVAQCSSGACAYANNTNRWVKTGTDASYGLSPVSTNGYIQQNVDNGRLAFYEKSSLSSSKGGYRLLAEKVDNYNNVLYDAEGNYVKQDGEDYYQIDENTGEFLVDDSGDKIAAVFDETVTEPVSGLRKESASYLTFDLFIRNGTKTFYNEEYNSAEDEAVYMDFNSSVVANPDGSLTTDTSDDYEGNTQDYGLANSVRVAFVQIARIKNDAAVEDVIGLNCSSNHNEEADDNTDGGTSLCTEVGTTIWEPNDMKHDSNLTQFVATSCKKRGYATESPNDLEYKSTPCDKLYDNKYYHTYVIANNSIAATDNIDIYDGTDINSYDFTKDKDGNTQTYKLEESTTFTDSQKGHACDVEVDSAYPADTDDNGICAYDSITLDSEGDVIVYNDSESKWFKAEEGVYTKSGTKWYKEDSDGELEASSEEAATGNHSYVLAEKDYDIDNRKELFKLAPNSITKVRVYVYLEGQDIDNYDLITKGKQVLVNFGLTKDKYATASSESAS